MMPFCCLMTPRCDSCGIASTGVAQPRCRPPGGQPLAATAAGAPRSALRRCVVVPNACTATSQHGRHYPESDAQGGFPLSHRNRLLSASKSAILCKFLVTMSSDNRGSLKARSARSDEDGNFHPLAVGVPSTRTTRSFAGWSWSLTNRRSSLRNLDSVTSVAYISPRSNPSMRSNSEPVDPRAHVRVNRPSSLRTRWPGGALVGTPAGRSSLGGACSAKNCINSP